MDADPPDAPGGGNELIRSAARFSRYVRRLIEAEPSLPATSHCERPYGADEMQAELAGAAPADEPALSVALRRLRKRVMLRLIARDLGGLAPLEEVVATTTALAETVLRFSAAKLHSWTAQQYGEPRGADGAAQQLMIVGMGKLGGRELNASSDVDLVFVYPEEGETTGARRISNHEFFARLARRLISALGEMTAEGYVFRVDMRLRPYGDSGPLTCSLGMLENYLITQGREWERYAWIKARVVCGEAIEQLDQLIRPFVFRRHLDFSAFASMRELHRQIRQEVARRDIADNIKLGRGGIREIEFIAQVFQLIRGGRDAGLRIQPTMAVLSALAQRGLLEQAAVTELCEAYVFLRNLEHRLQYLDDQQTHALPAAPHDQALIATAMGHAGVAEFDDALSTHRARVSRHFEKIFALPPEADAPDPYAAIWQQNANGEDARAQLSGLGYRDAGAVLERLAAIRRGARYRDMPASSRSKLDTLVPRLLCSAAHCDDPDVTLVRLLDLLETVSRREAYLALLIEYPESLELIAKLLGASGWAAQYLTQHPILLDELLDTRRLYAAPDWQALRQGLAHDLDAHAGDTERQMDILRHFKHAQTFHLAAQDLAGLVSLETLSDHLSDLAGLVLGEVVRCVWASLSSRHREAPRFAVVGYGKLGGKELGYASDLDIIFLYDDDAKEAAEIYARMAQRINTWLASMTPAGVLYETDLRLRPNGSSGLLVSSFAAFQRYQQESAWVWEHQALTRARFAAGDADIGRRFESVRKEVLCKRRDDAELRREILSMRRRMHEGHPNTSGRFDLKHDVGGIIDVEFIVQYLVLGHAHRHPGLTDNVGNLALLHRAGELGLIDRALADSVHDAYRRFRRLQHALRLKGERYARVERTAVDAETHAVTRLWQRVFGSSDS